MILNCLQCVLFYNLNISSILKNQLSHPEDLIICYWIYMLVYVLLWSIPLTFSVNSPVLVHLSVFYQNKTFMRKGDDVCLLIGMFLLPGIDLGAQWGINKQSLEVNRI